MTVSRAGLSATRKVRTGIAQAAQHTRSNTANAQIQDPLSGLPWLSPGSRGRRTRTAGSLPGWREFHNVKLDLLAP